MLYFIVFIGAGLGGLTRVVVSDWIKALMSPNFPYATLFVNLSGCFFMGFLVSFVLDRHGSTAPYYFREVLAIGFLGGYTTFSTFSMEALELIMKHQWSAMAAFLLGHYCLTLVASALGYCMGRG